MAIGPYNSNAELRIDSPYLCKCGQVFCSSETPRASGLRMAPITVNPDSGLLATAQTSAIGSWQMYAACLRLQRTLYTVRTPAAFDPTSNPAVVVVSALRTWFAVADSSALWLCVSCHASISGYAWDDNDCSNLEQFNISVAA